MKEVESIPIKLVIVGDGAVGKTCILSTYVNNSFPTQYVPTVFDNKTATIKIDGNIVNLSLWDTAGQQQYQKLRPLAYPTADVFVIAFNVVEYVSFQNATKKWIEQINCHNQKAPKVIVGNKIDLRDSANQFAQKQQDRPVLTQSARKIVQQQMGLKYFQCSALLRKGISQLMIGAVKQSLKAKGFRSSVDPRQKKSQACCEII